MNAAVAIQSRRSVARRLIALLLPALLVPRAASAQYSFALERFQPTPAGDRFLGVPSPYVAGELSLHAALLASYGYRPLVLESPPAATKSLVSDQLVLHANVSLALSQRVLFNLDVPALSVQAGETTPALHVADWGDIRLGGRARVLGDNGAPIQLGLGGYLWLPTATGATTGDDRVRGMPYLALGGLGGRLLWSAIFGAEFRRSQRYHAVVREGSSLDFGGALGYLVDEPRRLQLGIEGTLSFVVAEPSWRNLNAALLLSGRYRFLERFEAGVGFGPGLSQGVGTSTLQAVVFFAYVPVADLFPPERVVHSKNPPASADDLMNRAIRLPRLRDGGALDPRCCAVVPPGARRATELASPAAVQKPASSVPTAILFGAGSAALSPSSERAIHALADYLIIHPEFRRIELSGYADIHGTVESNERLGAQRAEAVRRALVRHSVAPDRLVIKSYGATGPVASSTTPEGMHQNRRVVIRIVEATPAQ